MALVDLDSWSTEFESCKRLGTTLLSQLSQREKKKHLSSEYSRYTNAIQVGLKQYDRELAQLKFKLNEAVNNKSISDEESESRQQQLDLLQTQRLQLHSKYNDSAISDRNALLQNPSTSNVNAEEDSDSAPIIDTNGVHIMKQHQIDMLEEQNRGLETLSKTLSRQKNLATQLGQEVEEQNDILDNLANTIERVEAGVSLETRNVGTINRRDSTCGYWVIIIILMIIILIVAVL